MVLPNSRRRTRPLPASSFRSAYLSFFACLAILLGPASAIAAGQLLIVAHEDDDLYFMTPALPCGIATGGGFPLELAATFSMPEIDGDGRSDLCAAGPTELRCAVLDDPLAAPEPGFGTGLQIALGLLLGLFRNRRSELS